MVKNRLLLLILIFSLAINLGVFATIGYELLTKKRADMHQGLSEPISLSVLRKKLNLSESQIKTIYSHRKTIRSNMKRIRKELQIKEEVLFDLLKKTAPAQEDINVKLQEIGSLQGESQKIIIDNLIQMKNNLTPEQQKIFFFIITERIRRHGLGPD